MQPALRIAARPPRQRTSRLIPVLVVATGAAALAGGAKAAVPFWPVPATLQTLALPLLALACARRDATLAAVCYLLLGLLGLPVFAGSPPAPAGLAYLAGPTAGYLLAMPLAAWLTASLGNGRTSSWRRRCLAALCGNAVVLALGTMWLAAYLRNGSEIGSAANRAVALGLTPFVLGDALKAVLAASLSSAGGHRALARFGAGADVG